MVSSTACRHHTLYQLAGCSIQWSRRYATVIIIMVIFKSYFSGEHIALSIIKKQQWCEHRIRKNQQIKSTVHDANQYMK